MSNFSLCRRIVVIGGGAAGCFAAIACAESNPQIQVIILEGSSQLLSKVRISGGGRCNVTHACDEPALLVENYPRGGQALRGAFSRFQVKDVVQWFQRHGVRLKTELDGRMFPETDNSETIVDCLLQTAQRYGVELRTKAMVTHVQPLNINPTLNQTGGFEVSLRNGEQVYCDRLLLATGGSPTGHHLAKQIGHHIIPIVPSLFTFNLSDPRLQGLGGVAINPVQLTLHIRSQTWVQTGALLITHWGISGPAVLRLSAWAARELYACNYQATLHLNWLPQISPEQVKQRLGECKQKSGKRTITSHCPFPLPRRVWQSLIIHLTNRLTLDPQIQWAQISKPFLHYLVTELTCGEYQVHGKGAFKEEFVTCGGIDLKEVDFKTMTSRLCPGLFFAGEILDIDGITGGFNFQSAWTTGWMAGKGMGQF